jgi:hypothetical protein
MKYFFSAPSGLRDTLSECEAQNYLLSYAVDAKDIDHFAEHNLIVDSGAFSAWNSGKEIDIEKYAEFCLSKNPDWTFISLDVIPETGSGPAAIEKCCEQGYENYLWLKDKGIKNLMPVFHYGDNFKWLKKFMDVADYIGISPANDTHENVKVGWCREVFKVLKADYKTHALGYTTLRGVTQFPFYSIDSISYKRLKVLMDGQPKSFFANGNMKPMLEARIKEFLYLEEIGTELWKRRGVTWP